MGLAKPWRTCRRLRGLLLVPGGRGEQSKGPGGVTGHRIELRAQGGMEKGWPCSWRMRAAAGPCCCLVEIRGWLPARGVGGGVSY